MIIFIRIRSAFVLVSHLDELWYVHLRVRAGRGRQVKRLQMALVRLHGCRVDRLEVEVRLAITHGVTQIRKLSLRFQTPPLLHLQTDRVLVLLLEDLLQQVLLIAQSLPIIEEFHVVLEGYWHR